MTTTAITPEDHIALLRHLASGKTLDAVALIMQIERSEVLDVASKHGYPDPQKLAWAADVLVEKLDQEQAPTQHPQAAAIARAPARPTTPAGGASTPPSAGPGSRPQPAAPPSPVAGGTDRIRALIDEGKAHSTKRIRTAAEKAAEAVRKLRELVEADREREAERKRQAEERAAAEREVKELEKQLAEAKAKLRPARPATTSTPEPAGEGPSAAEIREWAAVAGVECPTRGMVPKAVREAYDSAHQAGAA